MEHARPPLELCVDGSPVSRADAWRRWKMQFILFIKASGVHKEDPAVQSSLLINLIGPDGFDIYQTFTLKDSEKDDIDVLLKKYDDYFGVKTNITLARYNFFTRNQDNGESICQYVTALKLLSKFCEFSSLEDDLIRDRIVCGIRSSVVRDRLLRAEDLTLAKAVKICQADELSCDGSRRLEGLEMGGGASTSRQGLATVDTVEYRGRRGGGAGGAAGRPGGGSRGGFPRASQRRQPEGSMPCHGCGLRCQPGRCPAKNIKCYVCNNIGHYARMCQMKKSVNKVHEIVAKNSDSEGDYSDSFYISMLENVSVVSTPSELRNDWYETLTGECGQENFKLDTGADINVLSFDRFLSLGYNPTIINLNCNIKLQSYSGDIIPVKGVCHLKWWYKNKMYILQFAIANIKCQSVLGRQTCTDLGLIRRVHSINMIEFNDLFTGLGCLPGKYHIVIDESVQPVVSASRKVPLNMREKLQGELNRMIELGVIRKVDHPTRWVNSVVIAAKKNGDLRICLDPRPLNRAIQRAHFQLPTVNEIAAKLHGAQYFSVLDANSGFWCVQLDTESADLCTFATPFGRYQYLRLPYGINCAPEVFHAKIKQLLVEGLEGVDSFIDDVICWGRTKAEHDHRLNLLLKRARHINLKFNKDKCKICVEEVTYLGHVFNRNGMKPDPAKVIAVKDMPAPTDKKSLERFLGCINYLSKFIPNYSDNVYPLTYLLKKDVAWNWELGHQNSFCKLKELVCNAPVLALFDVSQPVVVSVDASARALGAVLLQAGRPVEYASRTLTDAQTRYAQIEKELLAIVFACEKFHQYIYGSSCVIVETDHKPLESIFEKSLESVPVRLQRMLLRLQCYDLKVRYKPGKFMYLPDTLSRAPLPILYEDNISKGIRYQVNFLISSLPISHNKLNLIKNETLKDTELCRLLNFINNGWPEKRYKVPNNLKYFWSIRDQLFTVDNVIFKNKLVLIPASLRNEMLTIVHDGHQGLDRCKRRAREVLFWPGITRDIELYVKSCKVCQESSNAPHREPMIPVDIPTLPWNKVGTDIFEYGKKYYLIIVDYFSGFVEVKLLSNITSKAVIDAMKENFARYGIPETIVSDNGTQFSSRDFKRFASLWGFEHITSSPNYAQSNGKSERAVQTVKKMLIKSINSGTDFQLDLLSYRNTPRDNLNSPAQLLMGRRLNCRLPVHPELLEPQKCTEHQHNVLLERQRKSKQYYDVHTRDLPELNVGDHVIMLDKHKRIRGQVHEKYRTPRSYVIKNKLGIMYRRNRRHLIKCLPEEHNISQTDNHHQYKEYSPGCDDEEYEPSDESKLAAAAECASTPGSAYVTPVTRRRAKTLLSRF